MSRCAKIVAAVLMCTSLLSPARAENTHGWSRHIRQYGASQKVDLPIVNLPKPGWSVVGNIHDTDGTTDVLPCSDPNVVAIVRDGITQYFHDSTLRADSISMETIWAHESFGDRMVCETRVTLPGLADLVSAQKWRFETFSDNGEAFVFFYTPTP